MNRRNLARLVATVLALVALAGCLGIRTSGASFTKASSSTVSVGTPEVSDFLHLYSQSTDPDGLGGYYRKPGTTQPAATGIDESLAVDLGSQGPERTTCSRVFTLRTAASFPTGVASVTITATLVPDPGTGVQPITQFGFAGVGGTGRNNPVTLSANAKRQCNLVISVPGPSGTVYHPTVNITVTYSGFSTSYFRYSIPFTVTAI